MKKSRCTEGQDHLALQQVLFITGLISTLGL